MEFPDEGTARAGTQSTGPFSACGEGKCAWKGRMKSLGAQWASVRPQGSLNGTLRMLYPEGNGELSQVFK